MKLVPNYKDAWKWWSMQLLVLNGLLQGIWEAMPPDALAVIPQDWRGYITIGLLVLAGVVRLIDQGLNQPADEK